MAHRHRQIMEAHSMSGESNGVLVRDVVQTAEPQMNPMQMIAQAVSQGADVDKLSKLMDLQQRWAAEEARKAFISALNAFKANPPEILKNKSVSHNGIFKYKHASLDNASGAIGKALSEHKISHRWDTEQREGGVIRVTCVLTHELGHSERTPLEATPDASGGKNSIQAVGSTVSYLMRYTLLAATGMAVADGSDDDGRQGKKMADQALADLQTLIKDCKTLADCDAAWAAVAKATTAAGDVEAHEELRGLMVQQRKAVKQPKQETGL